MVLCPTKARAQAVLDLSSYNFWKSDPVSLDVNWDLYPNQFLTPHRRHPELLSNEVKFSKLWNDIDGFGSRWSGSGYASYQVTLKLPGDYPKLGIRILDMYTAYRLYADGELIAASGVPGTMPETTVPKWIPNIAALPVGKDSVLLTLHIANFTHFKGGPGRPIFLGNLSTFQFQRKRESTLITLLAGGLIIGGLFFLGLFLYDRRDKTVLYFSLFCVFYSYRVFASQTYVLHELAPELNFFLTIRLEYLSLYFSLILFAIFLRNLYPDEMNTWGLRIFQYYTIFQVIIVVFPVYYFTALFPVYLYAALVFMFYSFWVFIMAAWNKRLGATLALNSSLLLLSSFVLLILEFWQLIPPQPLILIVLYFAFFLTQSLTLSYRFGINQQRLLWRAEASSRSKTEFISNMSHELRTPLNAILGAASLLENQLDSPNHKRQVGSMRKHAEHLTNVINEILSFSELETDDIKLKDESFDVQDVFNRLTVSLESIKDQKPIHIQLKYDNLLSNQLVGDVMKFKQALSHLGGTLVRHMDQGELTIEVWSAGEMDQKYGLNVKFKFNHSMMPSNLIDIFLNPKASFSPNKVMRYDSHAVGLHTASQIVLALKGKTFAEGIPVNTLGIRVHFEKAFKGRSESPRPINPKLKILVVEDNPVNRRLIEMMFNSFGLIVSMAEDGESAYHKALGEHFDLIFMDLRMPVMDGLESTRIILRDCQPKPVIIALTANSTEDDKRLAFEAGMRDFMTKPLKINDLKSVILKWQDEVKRTT